MSSHSSKVRQQDECICNCHLSQWDDLSTRTIEVENVAKLTNPWELEELFSQYGQVEQCEMTLRNSVLETLVTFYSAADALRVLEGDKNSRLILHDKVLVVKTAKEQPRSTEVMKNTKIDALNDDCLLNIFLYLSIQDRIRIERVCKRWRAVSQASWAYDKNLTLSDSVWECFVSPDEDSCFSCEKLRKMLLRCGEHVKQIQLPYLDGKTYSTALSDVAQLCPNLQVIDLHERPVMSDSIELLSRNCRTVKRLTIAIADPSSESALTEFVKQSTKLTYFAATYNLRGECLPHLPRTIQEIELDRCKNLDFDCLARALPKFQNLSLLKFGWKSGNLPVGVMEVLSSHCKQLKVVGIFGFDLAAPRCQTLITDLANLQVLNLTFKIDNAFLLKLSEKCKNLIHLNINCRDMTLAGIEVLAALPKLKILRMSQLPYCKLARQAWKGIKAPEIKKLPRISDFSSLKQLECNGCSSLSPSEICCLLESSPQIELVNLWAYEEYCKDIIEWLMAETLARSSKVVFDVWYNVPY